MPFTCKQKPGAKDISPDFYSRADCCFMRKWKDENLLPTISTSFAPPVGFGAVIVEERVDFLALTYKFSSYFINVLINSSCCSLRNNNIFSILFVFPSDKLSFFFLVSVFNLSLKFSLLCFASLLAIAGISSVDSRENNYFDIMAFRSLRIVEKKAKQRLHHANYESKYCFNFCLLTAHS